VSPQLAHRLDELSHECARFRESIRRIWETVASNLVRPALLELASAQHVCPRFGVR
jgi:hypothetical protein